MATFEFSEPPLLARAEFDRADQVRKDPDSLAAGWSGAQVLTVDRNGRFPMREDGSIAWSGVSGFGSMPPSDAVFLGVTGTTGAGTHRWAVPVDEVTARSVDARSGAHLLPNDDAGLLVTAMGLINWHRSAKYSPVDGSPTEPAQGGWVRRNASGRDEFPRTDPAVIMVVHDGADQVLLGRQSVWPDRWFSTLAGFVEPGESLEQCVQREVAEEAGIRVSSPNYLGSQPWPFPRSLMLGFEAIADPAEPLVFHDGELADARWFHRDEVRAALDRSDDWGTENPDAPLRLPGSISIARSLIDGWARAPIA